MQPPRDDSERTLAAVAYLLTWITGLVIFFVAKPEQRYAKWHAVQAIGYGVVTTLVAILLSVLRVPFLGTIWWLLTLAGIVVLALRAYQGQTMRMPVLSTYADKHG